MRRYIHFILWVLILFLTINISAQRTPKDFIYFTDTINKSSGIDIVKVLNQGSDSIKNAELLNLTSLSLRLKKFILRFRIRTTYQRQG